MTTEYQVMERLKETIVSGINLYLRRHGDMAIQELNGDNIEIDYPEPDQMRKDTMLYIQPDYGNYEDLSVMTDEATLTVQVFILTKGAPSRILIARAFRYYAALYSLLRNEQNLGGSVESTRITDMDYYPALTASHTMTAIEATVRITWSREFERR